MRSEGSDFHRHVIGSRNPNFCLDVRYEAFGGWSRDSIARLRKRPFLSSYPDFTAFESILTLCFHVQGETVPCLWLFGFTSPRNFHYPFYGERI